MKDITIISLADEKYYKMLKVLVKSSKLYFSSAKMYIVLVNMTEKHGEELKKLNPNLEYKIENIKFDNDLQKSCYCTNRRSYIFHKLRKTRKDILIWIDADCIIRKSCDGLIDIIKDNCDFAVKHHGGLIFSRGKKKENKKAFLAGVIVVGNSEFSTEFINYYHFLVNQDSYLKVENIGKTLKDNSLNMSIWMLNQHALYKSYIKMKDRLKLKFLPEKYCDTGFSINGVIWAAIWNNKYSNIFKQECKKIMNL
jgi:hypothetical protein